MTLEVVPCSFREASAFIREHHRHHPPVKGGKFTLAVAEDGAIVGVAVVGRPVARHLDDGWTLEVSRTCTTGAKNANSALLGAAWRAARALGYRRMTTYTLPEESGSSMRAAGWTIVAETKSEGWNRAPRPRIETVPAQTRLRWERAEPVKHPPTPPTSSGNGT